MRFPNTQNTRCTHQYSLMRIRKYQAPQLKLYSNYSKAIFTPLVMTCLLISQMFRRETEENHVKPHRTFGRITNCGPKFQTSVCQISGLDLDPYSFPCTVQIDCTLLSAKCHSHLADTYRLYATGGSDMTQQSVKLLKVNYYQHQVVFVTPVWT